MPSSLRLPGDVSRFAVAPSVAANLVSDTMEPEAAIARALVDITSTASSEITTLQNTAGSAGMSPTVLVVGRSASSSAYANGVFYDQLRNGQTDTVDIQGIAARTGTISVALRYAMSSALIGTVTLRVDRLVFGDGTSPSGSLITGTPFTITTTADTTSHRITTSDCADLTFSVSQYDQVMLRVTRTGGTHTGDMRITGAFAYTPDVVIIGTFTTPGTVSMPSGMSFTRASAATCRTGASTVVDLSTNQAGVVYTVAGYTGLQHEGQRTNLLRQDKALATTPWTSVSGVSADATAAPDGTTTADWISASSGVVAALQSQSIASSSNYVESGWVKNHPSETSYQIAGLRSPGLGLTIISSGWLDTGAWTWFSGGFTTDSTASQLGYFEWINTANWSTLGGSSADNGITAMASSIDAWGAQLEQGTFATSLIHTTTSSGTRSPTFLKIDDASACIDSGRLTLHIRCVPMGRTSDYTADFYVWYIDSNNYAKVAASTRILTVVIAGTTVYTATSALDWWQDRPLDILLAIGNGATTFAWRIWDTGWTVLTGSTLPSLSLSASPMYILSSNADGAHFYAAIKSVGAYKYSYNPVTSTSVKTRVNVVCDGNSLTAGTGAGATIGRWPEQAKRTLGDGYTVDYASAVSGQTTVQMSADYATDIALKYSSSARKNILIVWEGTNDLLNYLNTNGITSAGADVSAAVTYVTTNIQNYCTTARGTGWDKIIVADIIARGQSGAGTGVPDSFEPARLLVNTWLASNYSTFADAFVQLGNHSKIGVVATTSDTNWFSDYVHLTNLGYDVVSKKFVAAIETVAA